MLHIFGFVVVLLTVLCLYLFRGVIKQSWLGTTKDISKVEDNLKKENDIE